MAISRCITIFIIFLVLAEDAVAQEWTELFRQRHQAVIEQAFLAEDPDTLADADKLLIRVGSSGTISVEGDDLSQAQLASHVLSFLRTGSSQATLVVDWELEDSNRSPVAGVFGDLFAAYTIVRDEEARRRFGKHLIELPPAQRIAVEASCPVRIIPYPVVASQSSPVIEQVDVAEEPPTWDDLKPRNRARVTIDGEGMVWFNEDKTTVAALGTVLTRFLTNPDSLSGLPAQPSDAYIFIEASRETPYRLYTEVLDVVWASYDATWEQASIEQYGAELEDLSAEQLAVIKDAIPAHVVVEAEQ